MSESHWLRIDERKDVLVSLSVCLSSLSECDRDPGLWKWAILAMHNALQGAMVCHLSGTAELGALSKTSATDWLDWHERDRKGEIKRIDGRIGELGITEHRLAKGSEPPTDHLANARELFKRLDNVSKRIEPGAGSVIAITVSERASFTRLHDLRNGLSHFTPKGWSIEINGLPAIFLDILNVIQKIAADPWPFRHMDDGDISRRDQLIQNLRTQLAVMSARYSTEQK